MYNPDKQEPKTTQALTTKANNHHGFKFSLTTFQEGYKARTKNQNLVTEIPGTFQEGLREDQTSKRKRNYTQTPYNQARQQRTLTEALKTVKYKT